MNYVEALQKISEGKFVKKKDWEDMYMTVDENGLLIVKKFGNDFYFNEPVPIHTDDWDVINDEMMLFFEDYFSKIENKIQNIISTINSFRVQKSILDDVHQRRKSSIYTNKHRYFYEEE